MWGLVIGPGGAVMFALALALLTVSTLLRERTVSAKGSIDRLATSRPVLHSLVVVAVVLGIAATVVRMGVMT
ncbi:hypothetical protein OG225_36005 [Nocardia sp. NBC_01377]|uniref:hypothetical protein n=1 Tax=Nocardia sp. NBC_01377 TaxID=2903595 RepID=UPI00324CEF63